MVAFGGVARALRCAVGIQQAFAAYVPTDGGQPIAVHIGVHTATRWLRATTSSGTP